MILVHIEIVVAHAFGLKYTCFLHHRQTKTWLERVRKEKDLTKPFVMCNILVKFNLMLVDKFQLIMKMSLNIMN